MIAASPRGPVCLTAERVEGTPYNAAEMTRIAENVLDGLLQVEMADVVLIEAAEEHRPYFTAITQAARSRGVVVLHSLPGQIPEAKLAALIERDTAFLSLLGDRMPEPGVDLEAFAIADPDLDEPYSALLDEAIAANDVRWSIAHVPTAQWAAEVYPDRPADEALSRLGDDLLEFSWLSETDGPGARAARMDELRQRAAQMNDAGLEQLHLRSEGSDLRFAMLPEAHFLPCEWKTARGRRFSPNDPTDEIFSTPDAYSAEGFITTTRPSMVSGRLIPAGIRLDFKAGEVVRAHAPDPEDQIALEDHLWGPGSDASRRRIGEIGILDAASRVAQSGRTYYEPVMDEQSGTHIGLGDSYDAALRSGVSGRPERANSSDSHIDFTFGDLTMDIVGLRGGDQEVPLLRAGEWILPDPSES